MQASTQALRAAQKILSKLQADSFDSRLWLASCSWFVCKVKYVELALGTAITFFFFL